MLTQGDTRERELVCRAKQGNAAAFEELMAGARQRCLTIARSILGDATEAEDQVQNACFKAWRSMGDFREDASFSTWICRIATNECLMVVRKRRRFQHFSLDDSSATESPVTDWVRDTRANQEGVLGEEEVGNVLARELRRVPKIFRTVLLLSEVQGLSTHEVAKQLGISVPAVKSRLTRARREMRNRVQLHTGRMGLATLLSHRG